jgi:hypothetical protein
MLPSTATRPPGPLERTCMELERLRRAAAFRRHGSLRTRRLLRESDLILDLVEQCRLRRHRLVPTALWARAVQFLSGIDGALADDVGINRDPDHLTESIFDAQEVLIGRMSDERRGELAPIIPLFGDGLDARAASLA